MTNRPWQVPGALVIAIIVTFSIRNVRRRQTKTIYDFRHHVVSPHARSCRQCRSHSPISYTARVMVPHYRTITTTASFLTLGVGGLSMDGSSLVKEDFIVCRSWLSAMRRVAVVDSAVANADCFNQTWQVRSRYRPSRCLQHIVHFVDWSRRPSLTSPSQQSLPSKLWMRT